MNQTASERPYRYLDMVMALFITVLIVSNIASSAKIIDWGISIGNIPLAFDGGTLLFPISYIFGDVLTEVYGFKRSRRVIWIGFGALALSALTLAAVRAMPGEAAWQGYAGDAAFDAILGGMSTGGIVLASLLAYLAGEFANSVVLSRLKVATNDRWLWLRTISSTLLGEGIDSTIFILVAILAGVFPWELFGTLVLTNYIFKVSIEVLMTPVTYWIVTRLKAAEQVDTFDRGIQYRLVG